MNSYGGFGSYMGALNIVAGQANAKIAQRNILQEQQNLMFNQQMALRALAGNDIHRDNEFGFRQQQYNHGVLMDNEKVRQANIAEQWKRQVYGDEVKRLDQARTDKLAQQEIQNERSDRNTSVQEGHLGLARDKFNWSKNAPGKTDNARVKAIAEARAVLRKAAIFNKRMNGVPGAAKIFSPWHKEKYDSLGNRAKHLAQEALLAQSEEVAKAEAILAQYGVKLPAKKTKKEIQKPEQAVDYSKVSTNAILNRIRGL